MTPQVYLEVDSLAPAEKIRAAVVTWLDAVYRETLAPLAAARGNACRVGVLAEPPDRWRKLRSERVWAEALQTLSLPQGLFLSLGAGEEVGQMMSLDATLHHYLAATRLSLEVDAGVVGWREWSAFQERLVEHLLAAATTVGASTGFITSDEGGPSRTAFERALGRYDEEGLAESERWLRGVFWCTLLSRGHLEALGGIERVEREAPVARTRRLEGRAGPLLLLQASDDLAGFDTATLAPLLEFLAPVLPPPTPLPEELPPPRPPRPEPTVEIDPQVDADAVLRLTFAGALDEADRTTLDELLDAWYLLAVHGVFDGDVHNMDAAAYEESDQGVECVIGIDLGSAGAAAVDPLVRLLVAAADELTAPLLRIQVG